MNFPQEIRYAKSHEWLRMEGNTGYIGVSDYAQSELGDIVFVDVTAGVGDELQAGEVFGTIEAVKTVSDLYMPVAGRIVEVNPKLTDAPETINKDPYGDGWIVKIETSGDDGGSLMDSETYSESIGSAH